MTSTGLLASEVGDDHDCALGCEALRRRGADAGRAAGDERDLAVQLLSQ